MVAIKGIVSLMLACAVFSSTAGQFEIGKVLGLVQTLTGGLGGSNSRNLDYLIGGLSESARESRDKNRDLANKQSCLDQNTDKRRRSTITPSKLKDRLRECDSRTLRTKVAQDGCAYVVSGDRFVWGRPNQSAGMTTSNAAVRGLSPVTEGGFVCNSGSRKPNLRLLNAKRNICQAMKDRTVSQCPVCELKVLVDDEDNDDQIARCVANEKLRTDTQNARTFVTDCSRRYANDYANKRSKC